MEEQRLQLPVCGQLQVAPEGLLTQRDLLELTALLMLQLWGDLHLVLPGKVPSLTNDSFIIFNFEFSILLPVTSFYILIKLKRMLPVHFY